MNGCIRIGVFNIQQRDVENINDSLQSAIPLIQYAPKWPKITQ